jgi:phosphoribosylformylglycinamidine cyclo-ligase
MLDFACIHIFCAKSQEDTITTTYKDAGVDIDAADTLVKAISPLAKATARLGTNAALGGFGALFDLPALGYQDPILVAATDGVGTKLMLAFACNRHETIGIDLVAMCVNDLIVQGAEPIFFLDYYATGRLSVDTAKTVISGITEGCRQAGCALIGGETAEMPGMYAPQHYDLAGFAVGVVERQRILDPQKVFEGDIVLGLASHGVHSNGYSLVRRLVEDSGLNYEDPAPWSSSYSLGEALLTPTRIYVRAFLPLIKAGTIKVLAHITGGGLLENIPRSLPPGLGVQLYANSWPLPPVFRWIKEQGQMSDWDFARTFNTGIGMVVIIAPDQVEHVRTSLIAAGETVYRLGEVISLSRQGAASSSLSNGPVSLIGTESAWRV